MRRRLALLGLLLVVVGCGDDDPGVTQSSSPAPTGAANTHIASLAVDPADGTLFLGTAQGLYRRDPGRPGAERVSGTLERLGATGGVSRLLVVRFAGAEEAEARVSTDGGRSFDVRTLPGVAVDLAVDPGDPARMVLSTARRLFTSPTGGAAGGHASRRRQARSSRGRRPARCTAPTPTAPSRSAATAGGRGRSGHDGRRRDRAGLRRAGRPLRGAPGARR